MSENLFLKRNSIATQLINFVFSIYCVIAIIITIFQIAIEYEHTQDTVENELKINQQIFEPVLSAGLWNLDKEQLNNKDCFIVGKNAALLHKASKKLKLYRKNSLSINSWGSILNKIDNKINKLSKNLKDLMKDDLKDIKRKWPKKMPNGIIHSDLFIDNIFFNKGKFYGFIDFYFSANDFLSYELATCINALCFKKKNRKFVLDRKRSSNLLKGYQSVRKLSEIEKRNLNTLCRGSALRYLLTRSYDYLNTPKQAIIKIKDPKEYIDKLNFHRNLSTFKDYS